MFPDCFIHSANGMFSPINGIRSASPSRRTRRTTRRYKKSPRPHMTRGGAKTRRIKYVRLSRTRKNDASDKANKKERSEKNPHGNTDESDNDESDDGKYRPYKSSDEANHLTEYEHRVVTLGESEERDDEKNSISNLHKTSENGDIHGDLPLFDFSYLYSTVAVRYSGNGIGNGIGNIPVRLFILFLYLYYYIINIYYYNINII